MAKKIFFVIFLALFLGCQQSTDNSDYPENGLSLVTIENVQYFGSAYLSTDTTENFIFNSIILDIDDSTKIEILREKFEETTYRCNPTENTVIMMTYSYRSVYSAKEGALSLIKVKPDQIIGEFDILVKDATSSCAECPEDIIKVAGIFNAIQYN